MSKTPAKTATKPATRPAAKQAKALPAVKPAVKGTKLATKARDLPAAKSAAKSTVKPAAKPVAKKTSSPAPVKALAKQPSGKPTAPAPAAHKKPTAAAPVTKASAKTVTAPTPPQEIAPKKAPSKPATKLRSSRAAHAQPVDLHPPSVPLPPPSRPPPSNVIDLPRPVRKIDPKLANVWKTKAGRDLSEDELMSMPDAEYMKDKQLDFFRTRLMQQRNDLLDNAGETTEHLREDTSIVPDPADRATIEEEHALELRTRDRERKLLKKISQSIARIEAGDYGFCDETGEPIGLGRLLARPTATLSLEAQQRREMKQKMFGD